MWVNVVIPVKNGARFIGDAIASALNQPCVKRVIVVDDGSRDGTAQIVRERAAADPHIRLIALPRNRGRGYARSTGIGQKKHPMQKLKKTIQKSRM